MDLMILFRSYTKSNGAKIDYYEVHIKPLTQQVYPELPATHLVGYDGISPGPTFHMTFGTEAVVRFINEGNDKPTVTHLHGSISKSHHSLRTFRNFSKSRSQPTHPGTDGQTTQFLSDITKTTTTRTHNELERFGTTTTPLTILPRMHILAKRDSTFSQTMMRRTRVYRRVYTTFHWRFPRSNTEQMGNLSHPPQIQASVCSEISSTCK